MTIGNLTASIAKGLVVGTGLVALDRVTIDGGPPTLEALGGSCGNVLISLAMLGFKVMPLLRLGGDTVGTRLIDELKLAGADTDLVLLDGALESPIITEHLNSRSGSHSFSLARTITGEKQREFFPITRTQLQLARPVVSACAVFFADRLSETICEAMEAAAAGGAIIYFEPSDVKEPRLFFRAVAVAHVVKYAVDRLPPDFVHRIRPDAFGIVTAGRAGLKVYHSSQSHWCDAAPATVVRDTCGAGDMVTVGLLHTLLKADLRNRGSLSLQALLSGVRTGQRLAAENCAHVGARGIFRDKGAEYVAGILSRG